MSWLDEAVGRFRRVKKSRRSAQFCRQFLEGHVLADKGDYEGAIECFRDVPRSANEYEDALFNRAILLARLGYASDAETLFAELPNSQLMRDNAGQHQRPCNMNRAGTYCSGGLELRTNQDAISRGGHGGGQR